MPEEADIGEGSDSGSVNASFRMMDISQWRSVGKQIEKDGRFRSGTTVESRFMKPGRGIHSQYFGSGGFFTKGTHISGEEGPSARLLPIPRSGFFSNVHSQTTVNYNPHGAP
jgi:hypothetical protein